MKRILWIGAIIPPRFYLENKKLAFQRVSFDAEGGTWTLTTLRPLSPEPSASANSATSACEAYFIRKEPFVNLNANSQLTHHLPIDFSSNCNPAGIKSGQLQRTNSSTRSPTPNLFQDCMVISLQYCWEKYLFSSRIVILSKERSYLWSYLQAPFVSCSCSPWLA